MWQRTWRGRLWREAGRRCSRVGGRVGRGQVVGASGGRGKWDDRNSAPLDPRPPWRLLLCGG